MILARIFSSIYKDGGIILIDAKGQKYICGSPRKDNPVTIKLLKDSHYTDINGTAFGKSGSLGDLEKDANDNCFSLVFIDNNEGEVVKNIVDIVDDTTFVIDSPFNEEQLVDGKIFLFGQKVTNFNFLNKNAIWTLATAALQEVDRQLQAEKVKTATLESQVAALLAKYPVD